MNKLQIEEALKTTEANTPEGTACVRFEARSETVDDNLIRGTRAGLVQLGLRLIRAGITDEDRRTVFGGIATDENPKTVTHQKSPITFEWIEISDELEGEPVWSDPKPTMRDYLILFLVVGATMALFAWLALKFT